MPPTPVEEALEAIAVDLDAVALKHHGRLPPDPDADFIDFEIDDNDYDLP